MARNHSSMHLAPVSLKLIKNKILGQGKRVAKRNKAAKFFTVSPFSPFLYLNNIYAATTNITKIESLAAVPTIILA